jgi:hypothetical protein
VTALFLAACGALDKNPTVKQSIKSSAAVICMEKNEPDRILAQLSAHGDEPADSKMYVVFMGAACSKCPELKRKITNVRLDYKLIYLNVDFTWAFILSQQIGVRGIPSLVVFIQGTPKFVREGNRSILEYLHGNAKKEFE